MRFEVSLEWEKCGCVCGQLDEQIGYDGQIPRALICEFISALDYRTALKALIIIPGKEKF